MKRFYVPAIIVAVCLLAFGCPPVPEEGPPPAFHVTYDGNDHTTGSPPVDPASYLTGQPVTVLDNTGNLEKSGCDLSGWNTAANGGGAGYAAGQSFLMGTEDITLYAQWTDSSLRTVTYNGNGHTGGSVPLDGTAYSEGQAVTVLGNIGNLSTLQDGISLLFTGWNTEASGAGTGYDEGDSFTIGAQNVTLYAQWSIIRGTGPAGGLIFYDKGNNDDGWRYLEAAPVDQSGGIQWYNGAYALIGARNSLPYTGHINTTSIVLSQGAGSYAAKLCESLSLGGYDDWFLPSTGELSAMYNELRYEGVGDFSGTYWSSTEDDADHAYYNNFDIGGENDAGKENTFKVRAARAFSGAVDSVQLNVIYKSNGGSSGTVPVDVNTYPEGQTVPVLYNTGHLTKSGYVFSGWSTQPFGSGTAYYEGASFVIGCDTVILYAEWKLDYDLRDVGPAGGRIFYDKGVYSDGWRYLEAAPYDQSGGAQWGCRGVSIAGADGYEEGSGAQNTANIEAGCTTPGTAADICANLVLNGYDDWFLPSLPAVQDLQRELHAYGIGDFTASATYWSSTESSADGAWSVRFGNGATVTYFKDSSAIRVRAVRAF